MVFVCVCVCVCVCVPVSVLVSGPQTAFRLTRAHGEVSVICNLIARRKVSLSPLQKSDTKKEKGKGSEDLRLCQYRDDV